MPVLHIFTNMLYRTETVMDTGVPSVIIHTWRERCIAVTRGWESEPNYSHPSTCHVCGLFVVKDTTQLSLSCARWIALTHCISAHADMWCVHGGCVVGHIRMGAPTQSLGATPFLYCISPTHTKRVFTFSLSLQVEVSYPLFHSPLLSFSFLSCEFLLEEIELLLVEIELLLVETILSLGIFDVHLSILSPMDGSY